MSVQCAQVHKKDGVQASEIGMLREGGQKSAPIWFLLSSDSGADLLSLPAEP